MSQPTGAMPQRTPGLTEEEFCERFPDALRRSYEVPPLDLPAVRYELAERDGVDVLVPLDTGADPDPADAEAFTARPPSLLHARWDASRDFCQSRRLIPSNVVGFSAERLVRSGLQRLARHIGPHFLFSGIQFPRKVARHLKKVIHFSCKLHI